MQSLYTLLVVGFYLVTFIDANAISLKRATASGGPRMKYNFNSNWKLLTNGAEINASDAAYDDSTWKPIVLPHTWNEDEAFKVSIANLSTGVVWYRKHFKVPSSAKGLKIFLEFEGIRHGGEFYLNGQWIGRSDNGVMAFGFDVTSVVLQGKNNVIAARIDNSWGYREVATGQTYQWADKNFYANYGGINKNAYLHVTDKLYQTLPLYSNLLSTGQYIYATDFDIGKKSARVTAQTQIKNDDAVSRTFDYGVTITDRTGSIIQRINGGSYTLSTGATKIVTASAMVSGLEFWSWGYGYLYDVATILSVNNNTFDTVTTRTGFRKTELANGMFKLNDRVLHLKGYAQRSTNEWVALGSAVPAWLSDFSNEQISSSNGALVRWMHVTPWKQDVESLDRLGILQSMPAGDSEGDVTGRRWDQRKELMRDAIIYNRNNPSVIFLESGNHGITDDHMLEMKTIRDTYDPHGGRASGSREMLASKVAEYGGEMLYINKGSTKPFWSMEYSRDEGLRKYWDEQSPPYHKDGDGPLYNGEDASVYNRNQDSHAVEDVTRWFDYYEQRPGTGDRVNSGGVNIIFSDSQTHYRGAENYRRSGEVDAVRLPKDGWYVHKVMWNNWVDAGPPAVHIIGHWNYAEKTVKNVYVVSTAAQVELKINGKTIGYGTQNYQFLFTFSNVTFEVGTLQALGYDAAGSTVITASETTTEAAAALRLTSRVSPVGWKADGNDVALVDVEVIDAKGNRNPIALNLINFSLTGEATWRGGIAQGPDNYILAKSLPVENGVNRVILRSTTKSGKVTLSASSEGLVGASVDLSTHDFGNVDGLGTALPSLNLSGDLSRGPTPAGDGLVLKRRTVKVGSVSAGSNTGDAAFTYDDNEETSWTSSTSPSTGWIMYELAASSKINEVVAKLNGFRTSQYNFKIDIDGTTVWQGTSPVNLGYATFTFNATTGNSVTLTTTKGALKITEIEFYGPL